MNWSIKYQKAAIKALAKLDAGTRATLLKFLNETLPAMDNPRNKGEPLHGKLGDYWKYRVGDYRVVVQILDNELVVVVLFAGHRKEIYKLMQRNKAQ